MTAKKDEAKEKPVATHSPKIADGGLAALQERADADTARGYRGSEKEK